jgi:alpha-ribazole phosphatase
VIVYLVRHTSVANKHNLCYGQSEIELADTFNEEARIIAGKLPSDIDLCISSPLKRCTKLAEYLHNKPIYLDDALKELNFGEWELQPWNDIDKETLAYWSKDFVNHACPDGESFARLNERVLGFWKSLLSKHDDKKVLLVTHGGVIRSLITHIKGKSSYDAFEFSVKPSCVMRLDTPSNIMVEK